MGKDASLTHVKGRILIKVNRSWKRGYTFSNGAEIQIERDVENLDNAYVKETMGTVISGEGVPEGALILYHFNAIHPVNEIYNHGALSGEDIASDIGIYSIPEEECFLWKMPGDEDWKPVGGFVLAERVFKPYQGFLLGIEPTKIKEVLYIKTGDLKGKIVQTVRAADYRLIFRNEKGVDETIIRCRHFENQDHDREEIIAIREDLTEQLYLGNLLIGINPSDAKPLNELINDSTRA